MKPLTKTTLFLLLALALSVPAAAQDFWTPANTDGGTVTSLAASPSGAVFGTVLAGTDTDGIYRSTDNGENWAPTPLLGANVRGLAVTDNVVVWIATHGGGALRSGDLLATAPVAVAGEPDDLLSVAIAGTNPTAGAGTDGDIFLGSDGSGVYHSNNNGTTFAAHNTGLPAGAIVRSLYVEVNGAGAGLNRVWAGLHGKGLYRLDYVAGPGLGGSWTAANGANSVLADAVVHTIAIDASGNLFVGTEDGVYRSADDGANWTLLPDPDIAGKVVRSLVIFNNGTEYILAGTDGDYVARATTAAATNANGWTQFAGHPDPPDGQSGLQSRTVLSLLAFNGDLFAGTMSKGVHRSGDDGETWDQVSAVILNAVIQAMTFDAADRLFAGTFGFGILMSDDFGSPPMNWTRLNKGLTNRFIYAMASSGNYLYAGTWGNGVFRSNDGGENWYLVGLGSRLIYDLAFDSNGHLFAATDIGQVARSVDNGLTWQEIGVANTAIMALAFDAPSTIYAGTFGYGVYKSTDGGVTWAPTGMTSGHVFDFVVDGTDLYAATATGVQHSPDGGATWADFSTGLPIVDVRALALSNNGDLLAGTYGAGVYIHDGTEWVRDGLPGMLIVALQVRPTSDEVFVGTQQSGLYFKSFSTSTDREDEGEVPGGYRLAQNFPNPFNPSTRIEFDVPEAGTVRLAVFDLLGREVQVLVDGTLKAGHHAVSFEAPGLPGGVYVYQLQAAGQTVSRKMVLMK